MGTIIDQETTGEPLLLTGTPNVTDMTFRQLRQLTQSPNRAGVQNGADYRVTDAGAGAVGVALGYAWVSGTTSTGPEGQHLYGVPLPTARTLTGIPTPSSATRRDQLVVRVYDEGDAPGNNGLNEGRIQYIANAVESITPEAVPANSMLLSHVDVTTAGVKTIVDRRLWADGTPLVSVLPTNPTDGQEVLFQTAAMATAGVVWQLRFNAASVSSYKWEMVSGSPLFAASNANVATASASYVQISGALALTAPLAGEYTCEIEHLNGLTSGGAGYMSYTINGTAALDQDSSYVNLTGGGTAVGHCKRPQTVTVPGSVFNIVHRAGSGTPSFDRRSITLTPVRVG